MKNAKYLGIIAGICLIAIIFAFGQLFSVKKIDVYYYKAPLRVKTEEVIQASGISIGTNIFIIDEKSAIKRVEAYYGDYSVAVVSIERIFPNQVLLYVKERVPVFALPLKDEAEKYVITDESFALSRIVAQSECNDFDNLIKIVGITIENTFSTPNVAKLNEIRKGFNTLGIGEEALATFIESIAFEDNQAKICLRHYQGASLLINIEEDKNIISNVEQKYTAFLALDIQSRFGKVL